MNSDMIAIDDTDSVLQVEDDVSVLTFNDDSASLTIDVGIPRRPNNLYSTFEIGAQQFNSTLFDKQSKVLCDASAISDCETQIRREEKEEEPTRVNKKPVTTSIERMVVKLNRCMMRSAKSREMISINAFSQLRMEVKRSSSNKTRHCVTKARRVSYNSLSTVVTQRVSTPKDDNLISFLRGHTCGGHGVKMVTTSRQEDSLISFLRASKKR